MDNSIKISVELRTNNGVFQCELDHRWYNTGKEKCYAVTKIVGINRLPTGEFTPILNAFIICEGCWKKNIGRGLDFVEPSAITIPKDAEVNKILGDKRN
jgi:hypothetical protein